MSSPLSASHSLAGKAQWSAREWEFAEDVGKGLTARQKSIPCKYLYDARGSALFERICDTPEYYPTRTETSLLRRNASSIARHGAGRVVVELGSGSGMKTQILLEALSRRQRIVYRPIDVSESALLQNERALRASLPRVEVRSVRGDFSDGIRETSAASEPRLIIFLGSTIGNFHPEEARSFLARLRRALQPDDRFLLGVDMEKDRDVLERAYNDKAGITAAFNRNLLRRINRELGGHFIEENFDHRAFYDSHHGRIEMHLVSREPQKVRLEALDLEVPFGAGETIHTESSYKYRLAGLRALAAHAGFDIERLWQDKRKYFSLLLLKPSFGKGVGALGTVLDNSKTHP